MKIEPFCFSIDATAITISTEDPNFQVKGVVAFASSDTTSNAFSSVGVSAISDALKNFSSGQSVSTTKSTDFNYSSCVTIKNGTTTVLTGGVTSISTAGEVSWSFSNTNTSYYVFGLLIGE